MIAMDEHVIVLDFKMGGESVASVVSTRDNMLPVPPAGSIVHVGLPQERQTFVTARAGIALASIQYALRLLEYAGASTRPTNG